MKKFIQIILCFIINLLLFTTYVNAESDACKLTLSADKTTLKPGDVVTITLKISDITKSSGIAQIISKLDYSEDIFEPIKVTDKDLEETLAETELKDATLLYSGLANSDSSIKNPWYFLQVKKNGNKGFYASTAADPQIETQVLGKMKLKVKNNASTTTTKVALKEIEAYDAQGISNPENAQTFPVKDSSIELKISSSSNEPTNSNNNTSRNNTSKNNTNTTTNNNANISNNTANTNVPHTGVENFAPIIIIAIIISIISYFAYEKYKNV